MVRVKQTARQKRSEGVSARSASGHRKIGDPRPAKVPSEDSSSEDSSSRRDSSSGEESETESEVVEIMAAVPEEAADAAAVPEAAEEAAEEADAVPEAAEEAAEEADAAPEAADAEAPVPKAPVPKAPLPAIPSFQHFKAASHGSDAEFEAFWSRVRPLLSDCLSESDLSLVGDMVLTIMRMEVSAEEQYKLSKASIDELKSGLVERFYGVEQQTVVKTAEAELSKAKERATDAGVSVELNGFLRWSPDAKAPGFDVEAQRKALKAEAVASLEKAREDHAKVCRLKTFLETGVKCSLPKVPGGKGGGGASGSKRVRSS